MGRDNARGGDAGGDGIGLKVADREAADSVAVMGVLCTQSGMVFGFWTGNEGG